MSSQGLKEIGMASDVLILCVEDDRAVLDALVRDLQPFAAAFAVEATETADEAREVVDDRLARGQRLGLVLADHILPGTTGVELLVELHRRPETAAARKVLVTAQAGLEETIRAVNEADLDHYIAKPWTLEELHGVVRKQLTEYVVENIDNLLPFVKVLDAERIMEAIRERGSDK